MRVLRKIAGVTRLDVRRLQHRSTIVEVVKERKEKWQAKVMEKTGS